MSHPRWYWLHLSAIVIVAVLCGASLYARAHANDYKRFGDLRQVLGGAYSGSMTNGSGAMKPFSSAEIAAMFAAIPDDTPIRIARRIWICRGDMIGQIWGSGPRSTYFNLLLGSQGGTGQIDGDNYDIDYGPVVAQRLKALVARSGK